MTWADYHRHPRRKLGRPFAGPFEKAIQSRARGRRFPRSAFRHHAAQTLPTPSATRRSTPFRAPQVPQFYADFYNTPGPINHGQTINGYWMEQSRGQVGIGKIDVFGP